uniref:transposase n=1 Tax=Limnohabitans sp. DM1 TaxID=1597955 RepID=UPI000B2063B7
HQCGADFSTNQSRSRNRNHWPGAQRPHHVENSPSQGIASQHHRQPNAGQCRHGQHCSNETHESKTDGDARLYRKGKTASELRFRGHTRKDNRNGLVVNAMVTQADGKGEREEEKERSNEVGQANDEERRTTLGADKGYDAQEFIKALQQMNVLPHVAQNKSGRKSAVPDAVADSEGYAMSREKRKRIEQGFGWAKTVGHMRQVLVRGLEKVDQMFVLTMTAYNLTRLRTLEQVRLQGAR